MVVGFPVYLRLSWDRARRRSHAFYRHSGPMPFRHGSPFRVLCRHPAARLPPPPSRHFLRELRREKGVGGESLGRYTKPEWLARKADGKDRKETEGDEKRRPK